jgi:hypothetical protein
MSDGGNGAGTRDPAGQGDAGHACRALGDRPEGRHNELRVFEPDPAEFELNARMTCEGGASGLQAVTRAVQPRSPY